MKLPSSWTTVTPLSKFLALFFFILFNVLGFYLGRYYQQREEVRQYLRSYKEEFFQNREVADVDTADDMSSWKTYRGAGITFQYPSDWLDATTTQMTNGTYIQIIDAESLYDQSMPPALSVSWSTMYHTELKKTLTLKERLSLQSQFAANSFIEPYSLVNYEGSRVTLKSAQGNYFETQILLGKDVSNTEILTIQYRHSPNESSTDFPSTLKKALSTFRFLDEGETIKPTEKSGQCAIYYDRQGNQINACATCGNNICEAYETCTPQRESDPNVPIEDCGILYCPNDCR